MLDPLVDSELQQENECEMINASIDLTNDHYYLLIESESVLPVASTDTDFEYDSKAAPAIFFWRKRF